MKIIKNLFFIFLLAVIIGFSACQQPGVNNPGSEYMPGMYHSIAYEANYESYYPRNQWVDEKTYMHYAQPRNPVKGTYPEIMVFLIPDLFIMGILKMKDSEHLKR